MKTLCALSRYNYRDVARGESYEYQHFLPAFRSLGHEVSFFDLRARSVGGDFGQLNRAFLDFVNELRPDIIFAIQTNYEIWIETWALLRNQRGLTTINWATDDDWKYEQFSKFIAPFFDTFVTTYQSAYRRLIDGGIDSAFLSQCAVAQRGVMPPLL